MMRYEMIFIKTHNVEMLFRSYCHNKKILKIRVRALSSPGHLISLISWSSIKWIASMISKRPNPLRTGLGWWWWWWLEAGWLDKEKKEVDRSTTFLL